MDFQGPQFMLAEATAELQASRLLTYWAASLRDQGKDYAVLQVLLLNTLWKDTFVIVKSLRYTKALTTFNV